MSQKIKNTEAEIIPIDDRFILQEYENLYINEEKRSIPSAFFKELSRKQQNERALKIIRFAFDKYLRWRPEQIRDSLTMEVVQKLKLDTLINSYVDFPPEFSKSGLDISYLAYLVYPEKFHLSHRDQCVNMLHKIYRGEIKKYPASWTTSNDGLWHLQTLIQYTIEQLPRFKNPEALYEFFASPAGIKALKDHNVYLLAMGLCENSFEAVHFSLPPNAKSEFLYNAILFEKEAKKAKI